MVKNERIKSRTEGNREESFYHCEKLYTTSILDSGLHKTVSFLFFIVMKKDCFQFRSAYAMSNNLSQWGLAVTSKIW